MIIECQTCHARFRLDESRIKGRGARVKCRKCGDSIVVLKEGPPPPPAPGGNDSFALGSATRDAAAVEAGAPGKDEMDLAFDRILSVPADGSIPFLREAEAVVPPERDASAGPDPRPETDLGALNLELGPEEKLDLPPEEELDLPTAEEPPAFEPPAAELPAETRGEAGFLISDMDALDYLQEKHRDTVSDAPPSIGDISPEISFAPVDAESSFLRTPDAPPAPGEDRASPPPAEAFRPGDVAPPEPSVVEAPPHATEEEPFPAPPVESVEKGDFTAPDSPRPRSSAMPAAAAVLAILLMAGGYLGLTASGRRTLEKAIPGAAALWGGKPSAPASPKYDLRNVIGYYENGGAASRILVIKGQVANLSDAEKSGIRVQATLLDNADAVLAQQTVYAGNVLAGDAIRKGDRGSVSKALGNRFGEGLANMSVSPGKAIPFMVVFFDAPATMDSYKLEAMDGE
jgi:predicted Zn finger-like uncharacterized protein